MTQVIYSVTVKIDSAISEDWKNWMIHHHIPDVMKTECFESYVLSKLRDGEDEHGTTFSIQYLAHSNESLQKYQNEFAAKLQLEHTERYKGRFGAFRTLLDVVNKSK